MIEWEQVRIDIKRQLNSYRDLKAEHLQIQEELQELEATMYAPASPKWDRLPRGPGIGNPVENKAMKHMSLEQRYREQLEKLTAAQAEVETMIEGLDSVERRLARLRYIDGLPWEAVCDKINYSWRQTHRIHSQMLDKLVAAEMERRLSNG